MLRHERHAVLFGMRVSKLIVGVTFNSVVVHIVQFFFSLF